MRDAHGRSIFIRVTLLICTLMVMSSHINNYLMSLLVLLEHFINNEKLVKKKGGVSYSNGSQLITVGSLSQSLK